MKTVRARLETTLKNHYLFEDFQIEDFSFDRKIKDLDIDSISLVELFLVVEEEFGLHGKISTAIDMETAKEQTLDEFISSLVVKIEELQKSEK